MWKKDKSFTFKYLLCSFAPPRPCSLSKVVNRFYYSAWIIYIYIYNHATNILFFFHRSMRSHQNIFIQKMIWSDLHSRKITFECLLLLWALVPIAPISMQWADGNTPETLLFNYSDHIILLSTWVSKSQKRKEKSNLLPLVLSSSYSKSTTLSGVSPHLWLSSIRALLVWVEGPFATLHLEHLVYIQEITFVDYFCQYLSFFQRI